MFVNIGIQLFVYLTEEQIYGTDTESNELEIMKANNMIKGMVGL